MSIHTYATREIARQRQAQIATDVANCRRHTTTHRATTTHRSPAALVVATVVVGAFVWAVFLIGLTLLAPHHTKAAVTGLGVPTTVQLAHGSIRTTEQDHERVPG